MNKKILLLVIFLVIFVTGHSFAIGNGEIRPGLLSVIYNVNMTNEIKAIVLEGEMGLTSTLAADGRYVYSSGLDLLDLALKFKLYENSDLKIAGRVGVSSDFTKNTPVHKTLGFAFTKNHNSFIAINGGCDYSLTNGEIGFFGGIDYQLASRAFLQLGYQKFIGQSHTQGLVLGLRTDL